MLTLQTAAVVLFGFYGMFVGIVLSIVGMYVLWRRLGLTTWRRPAFAWRIDRSRVRELMSFGFPIAIQGQIWLLFMSVDNLIVAGFLSVKDLGYYALGVSVTGYVLHLPRSIGAALFPRMTEKFGETSDIKSIRHYAVDTQRVLAYMLVPLFLGAAFFLVPVLIRHALPGVRAGHPGGPHHRRGELFDRARGHAAEAPQHGGLPVGDHRDHAALPRRQRRRRTTSPSQCSTGGSRARPARPRSATSWRSC